MVPARRCRYVAHDARYDGCRDACFRRPAPARVADAAADEPTRSRVGGGYIGAAPELRRDRPLATEPRDAVAPRGEPRRTAAGTQSVAHGRGVRAHVPGERPRRTG